MTTSTAKTISTAKNVASFADSDDAFSFWTFRDLLARRVVTNRTDLYRKQKLFGFPKGIIFTKGGNGAALYRITAIKAWLIEREAMHFKNTVPPPRPGSRPVGRPRKSAATSIIDEPIPMPKPIAAARHAAQAAPGPKRPVGRPRKRQLERKEA